MGEGDQPPRRPGDVRGRAVVDSDGRRVGSVGSVHRDQDGRVWFVVERTAEAPPVIAPSDIAEFADLVIIDRPMQDLAPAPQLAPGETLPAEIRASLLRWYQFGQAIPPGDATAP